MWQLPVSCDWLGILLTGRWANKSASAPLLYGDGVALVRVCGPSFIFYTGLFVKDYALSTLPSLWMSYRTEAGFLLDTAWIMKRRQSGGDRQWVIMHVRHWWGRCSCFITSNGTEGNPSTLTKKYASWNKSIRSQTPWPQFTQSRRCSQKISFYWEYNHFPAPSLGNWQLCDMSFLVSCCGIKMWSKMWIKINP